MSEPVLVGSMSAAMPVQPDRSVVYEPSTTPVGYVITEPEQQDQ